MIEYDITKNSIKPPFAVPPSEILIRCVYDYKGLISCLSGVHLSDGVHLKLSARPEISIETSYNSKHHHISILTANKHKYAKCLNTNRFIIIYSRPNKKDFLIARFPEWNFVGYNNSNFPIMELLV